MSQIFCPECGKAFDGNFALSYHRKLVHNVDRSHVDDTNEIITADLEKANKRIKGAYIAGTISGVITLIFALTGAADFSLWNLIDAALIFGLTFGVYKKNRACAVILLVYWVGDKLYQLGTEDTSLLWWGVIGVFTGYYIQGVMGIFTYHRIAGGFRKENREKRQEVDGDAVAELLRAQSKSERERMRDSNERAIL